MAETPQDADEAEEEKPPSGGSAVLRDRYLIDGSKPLPNLDSPNARAFVAEDRRDLSRNLFALVCTPGVPVRTHVMRTMKGSAAEGVMELVEWDAIYWPLIEQRTMAVVYERPMGGRVMDQLKRGARVTEYDVPRKVIQPIVNGLRHMFTMGVTHRAIRPDNFFYADEECQEVVLGECVTSPEGFDQPFMFEPIERAMAHQAGRGQGSMSDDMFSLGASLVVITLGYNPIEKLSAEDLLFRRLNQGSYAAIAGKARLPMRLMEPMRGLLSDEGETRWSLDEMEMWLNGRKQTPMQKKSAKRGDTPWRFGGRDHTNVRTLAHAFNRQIPDAVKALHDDNFMTWLRRTAGEEELAETLKGYIDSAKFHKDDPQGTDDYLVARACAAMDPYGPVRFKGAAICLDGFGPMLAVEMIRKGNVQVILEILDQEIYQFWTSDRSVFMDNLDTARAFTQLKHWIGIKDPGYGLERCLYELNPGLACQSPYIIEDGVMVIEDLLPALDRAANNADARSRPMDRHISGFIASRFHEDIQPHLRAIAVNKESTSIIGSLSLLAFLQWKLKAEPVYGLASWLGGILGPAINSYHSRTTRREIEREIPKLVRKGSLPDLFDLIDNAEKRQEDEEGYNEALDEYIACADEVREIEGTGTELTEKAEKTGQKTAAMISITVTMIAVSIIFISEML